METRESIQKTATRRDLQRAVCETAWGFYMKAERAQYDSFILTEFDNKLKGANFRTTMQVAPEYATKHTTLYAVCSAFAYLTYYNAITQDGHPYRLNGGSDHYTTRCLFNELPEEAALLRWVREEGDLAVFSNSGVFTTQDSYRAFTAMDCDTLAVWFEENWQTFLQPGDLILTFVSKGTAHTILYIGHGMIMESSGKSYADGVERFEDEGTFRIYDIRDQFRFNEIAEHTSRLNLQDSPYTLIGFGIFRPLNLLVDNDGNAISGVDISQAAAVRLRYSGLDIDKTVNISPYGTASEGGTVTYTVTVRNESNSRRQAIREKDRDRAVRHVDYTMWKTMECYPDIYRAKPYHGLEIKEQVPEGTVLLENSLCPEGNFSPETGCIRWSADIAPGEECSFSYGVRITGKRGGLVTSRGTVAGIPSAVITNRIGGKKPLLEERFAAFRQEPSVYEKCLMKPDTEFASAFYRDILDIPLIFPDSQTLFDYLFTPADAKNAIAAVAGSHFVLRSEPVPAGEREWNMLVRNFIGGKKIFTDQLSLARIREFSVAYLEAGDVFVKGMLGGMAHLYVYIGGGEFACCEDGRILIKNNLDHLWEAFMYDYFFTLRPYQAFDSLQPILV